MFLKSQINPENCVWLCWLAWVFYNITYPLLYFKKKKKWKKKKNAVDFPLHPVDSLQLDLIDCRLLWSISIPINHRWKRLRRSFPVLDCLTEINLGIIATGVWVGVANWGSTLPCLLFLDVQSTAFFFLFSFSIKWELAVIVLWAVMCARRCVDVGMCTQLSLWLQVFCNHEFVRLQ